jgi:hypothetical protein
MQPVRDELNLGLVVAGCAQARVRVRVRVQAKYKCQWFPQFKNVSAGVGRRAGAEPPA